MNPKRDVYGQEVWTFLQGKKSFEVIERDDGFIDFSTGVPAYTKSTKYSNY